MKYKKFDILKFENGKTYIVIDIVSFNNNTYLYLASESEETDYIIVKEETVNGKSIYNKVCDKEEFLNVAKLITEKNKALVDEILNEEPSE